MKSTTRKQLFETGGFFALFVLALLVIAGVAFALAFVYVAFTD